MWLYLGLERLLWEVFILKSITPKQGDLRSPYHEEPGVGVGGCLRPIGYVMEKCEEIRIHERTKHGGEAEVKSALKWIL